jgi:L-ascorbate metabolism protein UlaG (beta-lactamase superfamily)
LNIYLFRIFYEKVPQTKWNTRLLKKLRIILKNTDLLHSMVIAMIIKRFIQSCFSIQYPNLLIYLDPYRIPASVEKADMILITHNHPDHYDTQAIEHIIKDSTKIYCPASCKKIISTWNALGTCPGEKFTQNGLEITAVPAYNTKFFVRSIFHPKRKKFTGYIIDDGSIKIYHAGDTNLIPEMDNLGEIDIAFLPIGGFFTMKIEEAVEATARIQPKIVNPMHEIKQDLEEFGKLIQQKVPNTKPVLLTPENNIFEL